LIPICENPQFGVMQAEEVCTGMIELNSPAVFTLLSRDIFTQTRMCNELLGLCAKPVIETYEIEDFTARVLADKPELIQNDDYLNKLYAEIYADPNPRPTLTFLHLSDLHLDVEYKEGTLWDCDSYLCCREENGYPTDKSKAAG